MQNSRSLVPIYSLTLLLSAILLFSVQPMFTKMILPLLGGAPQVWNAAMLFFQACLLGGYAYAHLTARYIPMRLQAVLHVVLLILFVGVLPFMIPEGWEPPMDRDPTLWQLSVMALTVGGPFFVISGSAPMLQHWFGQSNHKDAENPYFLYGASNLGSMTALLTYPFLTEPMLTLSEQTSFWMYGYFTLIGMTALSALLVWGNVKALPKTGIKAVEDVKITNGQRAKWVILAAIPSSLMLGVTTYITTDIASVPLLWVLPLALYVGTFIIVFARKPIFKTKHVHLASGLAIVALFGQMLAFKNLDFIPMVAIAFHMTIFFIVTLSCHIEMADSRPSSSKLTEFYFFMSLGGVIGGFINAIIAPLYFVVPIEYPLALGCAMLIRYWNDPSNNFKNYVEILKKKVFSLNSLLIIILIGLCYVGYTLTDRRIELIAAAFVCLYLLIDINKRWQFGALTMLLLVFSPLSMPVLSEVNEKIIHRDRNFFGTIKILENDKYRTLMHGRTNHGMQPLQEELKLTQVSYFSKLSPVADVFKVLDEKQGPQKIAILGLGIGAMACYSKDGREMDFFEIDKEIAELASDKNHFTYLSDCNLSRGIVPKIILGDGRLMLEKQGNESYDAIFMDAFSSDNIPVHLLTREVFEVYFSKIRPDGLIGVHISNNYLDIEPVLHELAKNLGAYSLSQISIGGELDETKLEGYPTHYVVVTKNKQTYDRFVELNWSPTMPRANVSLWTDQYSNIFSILNNHSFKMRAKKIIDEKKKKEAEKETVESTSSTKK